MPDDLVYIRCNIWMSYCTVKQSTQRDDNGEAPVNRTIAGSIRVYDTTRNLDRHINISAWGASSPSLGRFALSSGAFPLTWGGGLGLGLKLELGLGLG
jgi:hypothetical protein